MTKLLLLLPCVLLLPGCGDKAGRIATSAIGDQLGTVRFDVSGNAEAKRQTVRGLKLLHHMTYADADSAFAAAIAADPDCAMAYWGRAMTIIHPVWSDIPSREQLETGWELVREAKSRGTKTERENGYITVLAAYFDEGWNRDEKDRLIAMDKAWEELYHKYPEDVEAACFFALFHLAPARFLPPDKSYRLQLASGAIVSSVLERIPDHPGALHYQIHAFDFPILAGRALEVCDAYGRVAPQVPHALHMPTHIYTREGMWEKSIDLNLRSAEASWNIGNRAGGLSPEYLHALDYAVYAYLQRGEQSKAEELRDKAMSYKGGYPPVNLTAAAFAFAAIPARCALETQDWERAAQLQPRMPESFPWDDSFIAQESIVHFARAIGALRSGNVESARMDIEEHRRLADRIATRFPGTYWEVQARTQQLSARAWLAFAGNRNEEAIALMTEATDLESVTEKEAVTPGETLPAGELLGDMLIEMYRYDEAVSAFGAVLERSPNRLHSLYGSGRAAELRGDTVTATEFYRKLLETTAADSKLAPLGHARAFLSQQLL